MNATKTMKATLIGVLAGLAGAAQATENVNMTFSKPTNTAAETVKVKFAPGGEVSVSIPAPCSAVQKRDLIKAALIAAGYDVPATGDGTNQLKVQYLTTGTKVTFDPGKTGEKADEVVGKNAKDATIAFSAPFFEPIDAEGLPSIFTAGIVTDVGTLNAQVSAAELNFQTDGPIICQALFQRLAPRAPQYGAHINYAGDRLEVYFDPAYTVTTGGIIFGTSSLSEGASGGVTFQTIEPPSCFGDVNGDGLVDLLDLSLLLGAYGAELGDPHYNPDADLDLDGDVDVTDLSLILAEYGGICSDD